MLSNQLNESFVSHHKRQLPLGIFGCLDYSDYQVFPIYTLIKKIASFSLHLPLGQITMHPLVLSCVSSLVSLLYF